MAAAGSDIDALYQLPLNQFTAARNALAAKLKKAGRTDDARKVEALAKPSVPAWAVNQLYWRHRRAFDQLMSAGDRFRKAQASQLAGKTADVRTPLEARRQAASELARLAATVLQEAGHQPTPQTMRRITRTADALATYGTHATAPAAGRLSDDVDPPGFEAVAALVPRGGAKDGDANGAPRVIPFRTEARRGSKKRKTEERERGGADERKARIAAARAAVRQAEDALREARAKGKQAESALKRAAARAKEAEMKKAHVEQRLEKAAADAETARQQAHTVAAAAEEAAQAVEDAERALEKARREMNALRE